MQARRLMQVCVLGAAAAALALLLAAVFLFRPFRPGAERPVFEKGDLLVCSNGDGTVDLVWPAAEAPAMYQLEYQCGELQDERYYSRPSARLTGLPAGEELQLRIRAVIDGEDGGKPVVSRRTLKASVVLPEELPAPEAACSAASGTVTLSWTGEGDVFEIFQTYSPAAPGTSGGLHVASTSEREWTVPQEEGMAFQEFTVRSGWRQKGGAVLCGPASQPLSVGRQDLPTGPLSLTYEEAAVRMYVLEWDGTRCDYFEVRERQGDNWRAVAQLAPAEHMRYDTGRLRSGSFGRFQVAAMNRDGTEVESEEVSFYVTISPLYSTIWPIQNLTLYENPGQGDRLASVPGGTALCVLAEEGDWFRVRYQEEYGWLDSRFCMVNLPEYIGDHCSYDIANSYRSLFIAHDAPIRKVTNQVISGFENIQTEEGEFLVPYLYPCAKKLLNAARAVEAGGYRLKIYEAFRPQQATRFLYDTTSAQLNQAALAMDGSGRAYNPVTGREVDLATGQETSVSLAQPASQTTTLSRLMTDNGRFNLGSFLAKTISAHNRGIAVDLTLERIEDGTEVEMQSAIHDLSWYAATDRNNLNAKLLANYMKEAGMNGLSSEWWHFQDDATKTAIGLNTSLYGGVSAEGWVQDDTGWRYRNAGGGFVQSTTLDIDGRSYTFDADGYAMG